MRSKNRKSSDVEEVKQSDSKSLTLEQKVINDFNQRKFGEKDLVEINKFCHLNNISIAVYSGDGKMCKLLFRGE